MAHFQSVLADLSDSLTTYMRTHGDRSHSAPAVGEVEYHTTCVEVQWPWIAFPAALALVEGGRRYHLDVPSAVDVVQWLVSW